MSGRGSARWSLLGIPRLPRLQSLSAAGLTLLRARLPRQGCLHAGAHLFKYDLSFAVPDMYCLVEEMRDRLRVRLGPQNESKGLTGHRGHVTVKDADSVALM